MAEARDLATWLAAKVAGQIADHHRSMDGGLPPEQYNRIVGRQAQLVQLQGWIKEGLTAVARDEDDDTEPA